MREWKGFKLLSLDIETHSPNGFPYEMEDPIVIATLTASKHLDVRRGTAITTLIAPPEREGELLKLLASLLGLFNEEVVLITYNGSRFDLPYLNYRASLYGLNLEAELSRFKHLDLYKAVKKLLLLRSYSLKNVENHLGIRRVIEGVSGGNVYSAFESFLKEGNLLGAFYNAEDSFNALLILRRLLELTRSEESNL